MPDSDNILSFCAAFTIPNVPIRNIPNPNIPIPNVLIPNVRSSNVLIPNVFLASFLALLTSVWKCVKMPPGNNGVIGPSARE